MVSGIVTFRHAQRLQKERDNREAAALRRALVAEIRENVRRLGGGEQALAMPLVPIVRLAWDQARVRYGSLRAPSMRLPQAIKLVLTPMKSPRSP